MTLACVCLLALARQGPHANIHTLVRDLQKARTGAGSFQEKYVWRIYHLCQDALQNKKWSDARRALIIQGALVDDSPGSELIDVSIPGVEFTTSSGLRHKLVIRCNKAPAVSSNGLSELRINWVWPHLDAIPNKKYSDFVNAKPYPSGSVLARVLDNKGVKSLAKKYPKVVGMRLSYSSDGPAISEEVSPGEHWPYVFDGEITLENDGGDGVTLSYMADSGFDPEHEIDWKPVTTGYVYKETAGPLRRPFDEADDKVMSSYSKSSSNDYLAISRVTVDAYEYQWPTKAFSAGDLRFLPASTKRLMLDGLEFKDHDYRLLSRFTILQRLQISTPENPNGPDPRDLIVLAKLKHLKDLSIRLDSAPMDKNVARAIASLPMLESFDAYGDLDRSLVSEIVKAPKLISISVSGPQHYKDADLAKVWKKKGLTRIDLFDETKIDKGSLKELAQMPRLTQLALSHLSRSDLPTVVRIIRTRRLNEVSFRQCPISRELLGALAESKTIAELNFTECKGLSDEAIQSLKGMKGLDILRFISCDKVTRSGAAKLVSSLKGRYELD